MWLFKGQIRNVENLSKNLETGKHAKGLRTVICFFTNSFPWWSALLFHVKHLLEMNVLHFFFYFPGKIMFIPVN